MSVMSMVISHPEAVERRERRRATRQARREAAASKVAALRDWRAERIEAARQRAAELAREHDARESGRDRVPARLVVTRTKPVPEPVVAELGTYRGVEANYADRRAMGQRGHVRPRRRREMPGATARHIERNRRAWGA